MSELQIAPSIGKITSYRFRQRYRLFLPKRTLYLEEVTNAMELLSKSAKEL